MKRHIGFIIVAFVFLIGFLSIYYLWNVKGDINNIVFDQDCTEVEVLEVYDGDTIKVHHCDEERCADIDVRYIGIDTPESHSKGWPVQYYSDKATEFNQALLASDKACITFRSFEQTDMYDRYLSYVYTYTGVLINFELIKQGYARFADYGDEIKYEKEFLSAQKYAAENSLGVWQEDKVLEDILLNNKLVEFNKLSDYYQKYVYTQLVVEELNKTNNIIRIYDSNNYIQMRKEYLEVLKLKGYIDIEMLRGKRLVVGGEVRKSKDKYYIQIDAPWQLIVK